MWAPAFKLRSYHFVGPGYVNASVHLYMSPRSCDTIVGCDILASPSSLAHVLQSLALQQWILLSRLIVLKPSCEIAACPVRLGWPVAAHKTGKAELHLQNSGRDAIRCLISIQCAEAKSKDIDTMIPEAIIIKCLGVVLFRDPGSAYSPNCRRYAQCMPDVFSKSLRFRRLK